MRIKNYNLITTLIATTFLLFTGCSDDNEPSGGNDDPCDGIVCFNGGYCANGECVCPDGYSGADCSKQNTPSKIIVKKIEVLKFPPTDNGAGWDLTSGADIYPTLHFGNTELWSADTYYENADPNKTYTFELSGISFDSPKEKYIVRLYDYDKIDADDFIGGIEFTPYWDDNDFPNVLSLDAGGGVAFKIYVDYLW